MAASPKPKKICIIGLTGSGKSSLGNVLLGKDPNTHQGFKTSVDGKSCTDITWRIRGSWLGNGDPIVVLDSPGHGDAEGNDVRFRQKFVEYLRKEGSLDAFLWVKDAGNPRFTKMEAEHFEILKKMFGKEIFDNLIIVLSKWAFDESAERRRQRQGISLDYAKRELRISLASLMDDQRDLAMVAVDAYRDPENREEANAYQREIESLWKKIGSSTSLPVKSIHTTFSQTETGKPMHNSPASSSPDKKGKV